VTRRRRPLLATRAALVAIVILVAGCGIPADDEPRAIPRDNVPGGVIDEESATTVPEGETVDAEVYLVQGSGSERRLVAVEREAAAATPAGVLEALFDVVVDEDEADRGITTLIPSATRLASPPEPPEDSGGTLTVDLTPGIFTVQGEGLALAFGQIVCTADALDDVQRVLFQVDGQSTGAIDGEGAGTEDAVSCSNYRSLLAPAD
jgi:spore germination protein GerM